jgi:hypothetical protein
MKSFNSVEVFDYDDDYYITKNSTTLFLAVFKNTSKHEHIYHAFLAANPDDRKSDFAEVSESNVYLVPLKNPLIRIKIPIDVCNYVNNSMTIQVDNKNHTITANPVYSTTLEKIYGTFIYKMPNNSGGTTDFQTNYRDFINHRNLENGTHYTFIVFGGKLIDSAGDILFENILPVDSFNRTDTYINTESQLFLAIFEDIYARGIDLNDIQKMLMSTDRMQEYGNSGMLESNIFLANLIP